MSASSPIIAQYVVVRADLLKKMSWNVGAIVAQVRRRKSWRLSKWQIMHFFSRLFMPLWPQSICTTERSQRSSTSRTSMG